MISTVTLRSELADCTSVQLAIQDLHDGDVPGLGLGAIDAHASRCHACTSFSRSLLEQRRLIRALPVERLPTSARSAILAATFDPPALPVHAVPPAARIAASFTVAAAVVLAMIFSPPLDPMESELARIEADMHKALVLAGHVINRAEEATLHGILGLNDRTDSP